MLSLLSRASYVDFSFRIDPSHIFLPNLQHPEVAILASATPSPMTPSEEKVPRIDLDLVNNNKMVKTKEKSLGNKKKLHIKESKLPILTKAVLSPTSTPRNSDNSDTATSETKKASKQRNLTKTVTSRLLSSLSSSAKSAPVTSTR